MTATTTARRVGLGSREPKPTAVVPAPEWMATHCPVSWCAGQTCRDWEPDVAGPYRVHSRLFGGFFELNQVEHLATDGNAFFGEVEPAECLSGTFETAADARAMASALSELAGVLDGLGRSGGTLKESIGASVHAAMVEHGLTVDQLAGAAQIPVGKLWRRLQGLASFTAEDLVRLARALGVEVGVLVT